MSCTFTPSEYQAWQQQAAERQRLKDAVVEAAKLWFQNQQQWENDITDGDFSEAVHALLEFERTLGEKN